MVFTALCNYLVTKLVIKFKIPETKRVIFIIPYCLCSVGGGEGWMMKETHFIACRSNRSEIYLYLAAWLKFKRLTIPSVD